MAEQMSDVHKEEAEEVQTGRKTTIKTDET